MVQIDIDQEEIGIVLDACGELLESIKDGSARGFGPAIGNLKSFIAKIRDNGEFNTDLREYAKEILEGE